MKVETWKTRGEVNAIKVQSETVYEVFLSILRIKQHKGMASCRKLRDDDYWRSGEGELAAYFVYYIHLACIAAGGQLGKRRLKLKRGHVRSRLGCLGDTEGLGFGDLVLPAREGQRRRHARGLLRRIDGRILA